MAHVFERISLYEEVWTTPLTKLGKKYGLSDNGLRKVCKALSIPLPKAGHWAKVAAGQGVMRTPLPKHSGPDTFRSHGAGVNRPSQPDYSTPEDAEWLQQRLAFESSPSATIAVAMEPAEWDRIVIPLRKAVAAGKQQHEKDRTERDREKARPLRPGGLRSPFNPLLWRDLDRGLLPHPPGKPTPFTVSWLTADRALAITNAVVLAARARGWPVSTSETGALIITVAEVKFLLRVRERQEVRLVKRKPPLDVFGPERQHFPTDRLALIVERPQGGNIELRDATERLESQLQGLFPRLYRAVLQTRRHSREMAALEARRRVYEEERRVLAQKRAVEEAIRKSAAEREARLLAEASQWNQAQQLRAYVAATSEAQPSTSEWQAWALAVADKIDPLQAMNTTFSESIDGAA